MDRERQRAEEDPCFLGAEAGVVDVEAAASFFFSLPALLLFSFFLAAGDPFVSITGAGPGGVGAAGAGGGAGAGAGVGAGSTMEGEFCVVVGREEMWWTL